MVKTIKIDGKNNYFCDSNDNIIERYSDASFDSYLIIKLKNSTLKVDYDQIKKTFGDQIEVQYGDDKFIIDDGYQPTLVKAGYVVYQDYDQNNIYNKSEGLETRKNILKDFNKSIDKYIDALIEANKSLYICSISETKSKVMVNAEDANYRYTIVINNIDDIVSKNHRRKENSLPFYPFKKEMDKYGTMYLCVFANKLDEITEKTNKKEKANEIVDNIIGYMNDYHFVNIPISKRIIYTDEI